MTCRPFQRALCAWLAFAGLGFVFATASASPGTDTERLYRVTHWTSENGLPQNKVQCLLQARDGYLWIGTYHGLARFDGLRFTFFDQSNVPGLARDSVLDVVEAPAETVWVTTTDGLLRIKDRELTRYSTAEGLSHNRTWRLCASARTGLWLVAENGLNRLYNGRISRYSTRDGLRDNTPPWLVEGPDGRLLVGCATGMQAFDPLTDRFVDHTLDGLPGELRIHDIKFLAGGEILVGAESGLYWQKNGEWKRYTTRDGLTEDFVHRVLKTRFGEVWVLTRFGGLHRFEQNHFLRCALDARTDPFAVDCFLSDLEGNLWVGTSSGLFRLQPRRVRSYGTRDGLPHENCFSVCEGIDGSVWVGTDLGLCRIRNDEVTNYAPPDSPGILTVESVWPDRSGDLWFAVHRAGLYRLHDGQITNVTKRLGMDCYDVGGIYQDRAGSVWFGCSAGVVRIKGEEQHRLTVADGLVQNGADAFLQDHAGNFWIANGGGLHRWKDGQLSVFTITNGMSRNQTWTLLEDSDGAIWFGTQDGLNRFKDGTFFVFTKQQGLAENNINCLVADDFDNLWLGCFRGIYRVSRRQLNEVADGKAHAVGSVVFGEADGMLSAETHGFHQPTAWKARDGRLWFSTGRGVVVIDPKRIHDNDVPALVVIQSVIADREVVLADVALSGRTGRGLSLPPPSLRISPRESGGSPASTATLRLGPGRARVMEIRYTANSFVAPEKVRFKYRLDGYDPDWQDDLDNRRVAFYTNLRPGTYRFQVKACNNHGLWDEAGAQFAFSLAPHLYQTWLFYVGCGLAVVGGASGIQAYRLRVQRQIFGLEQRHALEQERTRIARDLHDDLGANLTGIALQLDVAQHQLSHQQASLDGQLNTIAQGTRALVDQMREAVWAVNPHCDTLESFSGFLCQHAEHFLGTAGIKCRLDFPVPMPAFPLTADTRHHLFLVVKEALNNAVKHAVCSEVWLHLVVDHDLLRLVVRDNGHGSAARQAAPSQSKGLPPAGHGMENMRQRIASLGGQLQVNSRPGLGTEITMEVPLKRG